MTFQTTMYQNLFPTIRESNTNPRLVILGVCTFFLFVAHVVIQPCFGQWKLESSEAQQIESYLRSAGVDRLLVEHLELETASETDPAIRQDKARRLLNLYAEKMMSGRSDESNLQSKSELLLNLYPELATSAIRLSILQAKYVSGETNYRRWWSEGRTQPTKSSLIDQWRELRTELEELNRFIESEYQDQVAANQGIDNRESDSKAMVQIESLLLHTNYLLGWSYYFAGVLDLDQQKAFMRLSDQQFRSFLQIETGKPLTSVKAIWFDFSSQWQTRALVGLAMAQRGLNYPKQCTYCFDLIEANSNQQQTRDMRNVWELNSRLYLNEYTDALELIESFATKNDVSKSGRVAFWNVTIDAGWAIISADPSISRKFLVTGLAGLTRESQSSLIEEFSKKHQFDVADELGEADPSFELLWIVGSQNFLKAQSSHSAVQLQQAKLALENAIAAADETTNPLDVARCQFLIAKIDRTQQNLSVAADAFLQVSQSFDLAERETAAEAQWLAAQTLVELSRRNPRNLIRANRAVDSLTQRFPGSTYAKRAEFEKLKLNLSGLSDDEAIIRLSAINSDSLNYPIALNEIAKRRYKSWIASHQRKSDDESEKLQSLMDSELNSRRLTMVSEASKLKLALLVVDALLRKEDLNKSQIRDRLNIAGKLANGMNAGNPLNAEYRYYEFLMANRTQDHAKANSEVNWLLENAKGTRFERSAMVQLAQSEDQKLQSTANPTQQQIQSLADTFERLVSLLGDSPETIATNDNARIALARLAELKSLAGQSVQSLKLFEKLHKTFPNNKSYLRQFGLSLSGSSQFETAIPIWKRLSNGVEPGSDLWLEAKYNLAVALFNTDNKQDAQLLHAQTIRLAPGLDGNWQKRFDELTKRMESN